MWRAQEGESKEGVICVTITLGLALSKRTLRVEQFCPELLVPLHLPPFLASLFRFVVYFALNETKKIENSRFESF